MRQNWMARAIVAGAWMQLLLVSGGCSEPAKPPPASLQFSLPAEGQLSEGGDLTFDLTFAAGSLSETFVVEVDGEAVAVSGVTWDEGRVTGTLLDELAPGVRVLSASVEVNPGESPAYTDQATTQVEIATFEDADVCEFLNQVECLLPYPSNRFLESIETEAGRVRRLRIPQVGMPLLNGPPLSPEPFEDFDGFSPGSQVLMHFPSGVDLQASGAPVLLQARCCGQLDRTPYERVRTMDDTSLGTDSPTVLLDVNTGERLPHFLELDAQATGGDRRVLFLRPGQSLKPGHEFIVAVRGLVDPSGEPVPAEPAFRALRDERPSTVAVVEARRGEFEEIFEELARIGVQREDLILALRFRVRSDDQLTRHLLRMRDLTFEYHDDSENPFNVVFDDAFNQRPENDRTNCQTDGDWIWRRVRGTFETPFFLTPFYGPGTSYFGAQALSEDADGLPEIQGVHSVPFDIVIPCVAWDEEREVSPILIGHGLFGTGRDMVSSLIGLGDFVQTSGVGAFEYILGATDWRGLASQDLGFVASGIIGGTEHKLNQFPKLIARLRQGLTDTAVLARAMKQGWFNAFEPFQRVSGDPSTGVFPGAGAEQYYYGISLGGILGATVGAVSPDLDRMNLDVGASNFSVLLDRSTQFSDFERLLRNLGLTDPMEKAIGQSLLGEQWMGADPEGYIRHLTGLVDPPLPGVNPKKVLMTTAWLDKQVSNEVSEITARSLGLPNVAGSLVRSLVGIEDVESGAESGLVVYDIGSFDLFDPVYDALIPALANLIPDTVCDPHSVRVRIPASLLQLLAFLQPGGTIQNFCTDDGVCDGSEAFERPDGLETVCDPLS
ncbi:hypothetical protein MK489_11080 [Myxococcota bacterium]|nr:hypothetical protein [Myxococcota bacterium]